MSMSTTTKILLAVGVIVMIVLAARSVGCSPFPAGVGDDGTDPKTGVIKVGDRVTPTVKRGIPEKSPPLVWWDLGLDAKDYFAAMWDGKVHVWAQGDGSYTTHVLSGIADDKVKSTQVGGGVGTFRAVASYSGKLNRAFEDEKSVALQQAKKANDGKLSWYALRSFPATQKDAPSQVTFLGYTAMFFHQKEIYAVDPNKKEAKEAFKLPFPIYSGVEHMSCGPNFCIGLYGGSFPLMFTADWDWKAVPNSVSWKTVPVHGSPFANETKADQAAANKAYTTMIEQQNLKPADRLNIDGDQVAFLMRDKHVLWTCHQKSQSFLMADDIQNVRAISWAQKDLYLVQKNNVLIQYKEGRINLLMPKDVKELSNDVTIHSITQLNGVLLMEATFKTVNKRRLFAAKYKTWPGYAICQ